jgi:hypothetical protein
MTDDELADLKRDNAERKARRRAGQEPELWQPPEREVVKAPPMLNVGKLTDAISAHVEQRILATVEMLGEETGTISKKLRAEIDAVRSDYKSSAMRTANKLMEMREIREQGQREAERDILACRREIADLRDELRVLKAGGGTPGDRVWTNGTGARQ